MGGLRQDLQLAVRLLGKDPLTIAVVVAALIVVATLATLWPVRRATKVDSMFVLRAE